MDKKSGTISKSSLLVIAIISIGHTYNSQTPERTKHMRNLGKVKPPIARDESDFFANYLITCNREPICISEYACRLATYTSVHVIQMDDCEAGYPAWHQKFHELKLKERPGRCRHTYINMLSCINKLYTYVK